MIEFIRVSKVYAGRDKPSVNAVSLTVAFKETLVLVGTSGSGKTTLLKMVNRLIDPTTGAVLLENKDVREYNVQELRRSIGYVFQRFGLFPHFTVAENIAISLHLAGQRETMIRRRVNDLLHFMGLEPAQYEHRYPDELSGGEQQRVQVARALAHEPSILLMDEPFGALDVITRAELQDEILRLKKALPVTIVLVTHDIIEAFRLGDRIAIMHNGEIHQIGRKNELIDQPKTDFVRLFLDAGLRTDDR